MRGRGPLESSSEDGPAGIRQVQIWLALTDLCVIIWAVFGALILRFGLEPDSDLATSGSISLSYPIFSVGLVLVWWISLRVHGAYGALVLGHGATEYRLIVNATLRVFAGVALLAYALKVDVARGYVLLALPAGVIGLATAHRLWRRWLGDRRMRGHLTHDVLVIGDRAGAEELMTAFRTVPQAGYQVIGVCTSEEGERVEGVPVLGTEHEGARVAIDLGVDVVACSGTHRLGVLGLRRLGWALEGSDIALVVSPGITEVAGPRVVSRPVAGLPLLHVEAPSFSGPKLALKAMIDWLGAVALIVAFAPLLLFVALAIKTHDGGPVFFRQQRVGLDGELFAMVKFRSMVLDAEDRLGELRRQQEEARAEADGGSAAAIDRGVLFKMENDPRVTPIGRFIRRYSIDELPQLINVVVGQMSLVGPRPPLPDEVSRYEHDVRRRLLVKPGMTGLWQVNGRSDLEWEEGVRLDLYYVENWSVVQDFMILWRTLAAVLSQKGAY